MSRFLLLTILNLSLPFLLRLAWVYGKKILGKEDPASKPLPWVKLLLAGCVLLAISLVTVRFMGYEAHSWQPANEVKTYNAP